MKKIATTLYVFLFALLLTSAQNTNTLFFDDFEESISNDATFTKWTTENLEGWHYWHIVPGQHMRFENNDVTNNDWLVTLPITSDNKDSIRITFDYLYNSSKNKPKLLYTEHYNGNSTESSWTELDYILGENENEWHSSGELIIDNTYDTLYFAFHYHADANVGIYFLLDNFKVQSYNPVIYEKAGESEHFEFYTNMADSLNYHSEITLPLENQFAKLSSLWNRPGINDIFNTDKKVKIYYTEKENNKYASEEHPGWKNGFHDIENLEIFVSPLKNTSQKEYYLSLQNLILNEFSQLAIKKKFRRESGNFFPPYFLEGFGLYESGFKPRRDSILKYLEQNPKPDFDFIQDTAGINNTLKRDLIISNIEGQILCGWSYLAVGSGASSYVANQWPSYLEFFYKASETERIKLQKSTPNFDFYVALSDTNHLSEIVSYFEDSYSLYSANYKYFSAHKFNVVLVASEAIGMKLMNYDDYFNGGAACGGDLVVELSPNYNYNEQNYYSKYFGYAGMCAHEFFHIYYNHFMWGAPGGFWAEGTADFNGRKLLELELPEHSMWKIEELFTTYATKHNVEINLEHISTNPKQELDIYFLGDAFFEYIYLYRGGYEKIIEFFNKQMDYSVFNATYEEIDKGYINYLKSLVGIPTSINDVEKNKLNFWLSGNQIVINNKSETNALNIEVYSIAGQKIFQQRLSLPNTESHRISVPNLSSYQYYIVRIQSDSDVYVEKFYNSDQ